MAKNPISDMQRRRYIANMTAVNAAFGAIRMSDLLYAVYHKWIYCRSARRKVLGRE